MNAVHVRRARLGVLALLTLATVALPGTAAAGERPLPRATSPLFAGSGACTFCHDGGRRALVTREGEDLSIGADWRATMMANSARDPVWQAKVEAEVSEHPKLRDVIESKCTTCHAPMGRTEARRRSAEAYSLAETKAEPLALDGVSCTVCHQVQPGNLGRERSLSGGFEIDDRRRIFGPYRDVFPGPMLHHVGYRPVFGEHTGRSELCATCHTLFTPYVDGRGQIAGAFPEQVPWLEWRNSSYAERGTECQSCHMPKVNEPVRITSHPPWIGARAPFYKHYFVGANAYMLTTLRDSSDELGVTATRDQLETSLARTRAQLREKAVRMGTQSSVQGGVLSLRVELENLTGHKFPTGFPARRAWLQVRVTDSSGEVLFESGALDARGQIVGVGTGWEPHHDTIDSSDEVQVYEAVMKDIHGEQTCGLLRAAGHLKDNRIPPRGFTTKGERYGDVAIVGGATADENFNRDGPVEGTGRDVVTYRIDVADAYGTLQVRADLLYRPLQAGFVEELLSHETPAVRRLERLCRPLPPTPETVQSRLTFVHLPDQ